MGKMMSKSLIDDRIIAAFESVNIKQKAIRKTRLITLRVFMRHHSIGKCG